MKHIKLLFLLLAAGASYAWLATAVIITGAAPIAAILAFAGFSLGAAIRGQASATPAPHLCNDCGSCDPAITVTGFCTQCGSNRVWLPVSS